MLKMNEFTLYPQPGHLKISDEVAEWLRRWTANPMGSARVGSNPILVVHFFEKEQKREKKNSVTGN
jgi:hypothetical protein